MIPLKIQMFSSTELVELLGWVDKGVPLFFCHQRWVFLHLLTDFFIHRLLFFLKKNCRAINLVILIQEEAYVEFLQIRRVPLQERKCNDDASDVVPQASTISILIYFLVFHIRILVLYISVGGYKRGELRLEASPVTILFEILFSKLIQVSIIIPELISDTICCKKRP